LVAQTYGVNATGVDVDPDQIALAQAQSQNIDQVHFETADSTALPFEDASFDVVATAKMTHHIPNWQDALTEMLRVLKPGGYLVYNDIALPGWLARIAASVTQRALPPTPLALDAIAAEYGLEAIYRSRVALSYTAIWRKNAS
jgi:ubiquinone/menaquinone biosynthesis C-methylase UbiE